MIDRKPMTGGFYGLFAERFPSNPSAPFLILPDDRTIAYGHIDEETAKIARLLADLGLKPGDRLIAQTEKSPEAVTLYLACLRAGVIFVPLNATYTAQEMEYFIDNADPKLVVVSPERQSALADVSKRLPSLNVFSLGTKTDGSFYNAYKDLSPVREDIDVRADDIAAILYTSGTTGRSKGAMLTHGNLASNALTLHKHWGWQPGDVLLCTPCPSFMSTSCSWPCIVRC